MKCIQVNLEFILLKILYKFKFGEAIYQFVILLAQYVIGNINVIKLNILIIM